MIGVYESYLLKAFEIGGCKYAKIRNVAEYRDSAKFLTAV